MEMAFSNRGTAHRLCEPCGVAIRLQTRILPSGLAVTIRFQGDNFCGPHRPRGQLLHRGSEQQLPSTGQYFGFTAMINILMFHFYIDTVLIFLWSFNVKMK